MKKFLILAALMGCALKAEASGPFNQDKYQNLRTITPYVTFVSSSGLGVVTSSISWVAGEYNYITDIHVVAYSTGTTAGGTTPVICTSANILGSPTFYFPTVTTIGTSVRMDLMLPFPLRATSASDASTLSCPNTPGVQWNINLGYYRSN